jgi:hypothetical protein
MTMNLTGKKLLGVSVVLAIAGVHSGAIAGTTTAISISPQKILGNGGSQDVSLSKGGLHSAFESGAFNLVMDDGNNASDIFFRMGTSTISRISVNSLGQEARNSDATIDWFDGNNHADSWNPAISSDGKLVVFESLANNLDRLTQDANNDVANNTESDIFLRDVSKKKTYRLSGIMDGADGIVQSGLLDIDGKVLDKADAPWKIITDANERSANPAIAGTAKQAWVAFESRANNLTPPGIVAANNRTHIYVVDLKTKKIELVDATHDATGAALVEANASSFAPQISPDGRFVVYYSGADNLVTSPAMQPNGVDDIFIYDRKLFTTYQLSGVLGVASGSGGFSVVTEADDDSSMPSIAGGGKSKTKSYVIAFESRATDLDTIPGGDGDGDRDIFVVDFSAINPKDANSLFEIKSVKRISAPVDSVTGLISGPAALQGNDTNASNRSPVIAGTNLSYKVAFRSTADNLLANPLLVYWNQDSNGVQDTYIYTSSTMTFERANVDVSGVQGSSTANNPAISPDAKAVGFDTTDQYLVPELFGNGNFQVYLRKL